MSEPVFRVDHVTRVFGRREAQVRALDDVSLVVEHGERLGIVGESGSGKSTLIKHMLALDTPDQGTISFEGRNLAGLKEKQLGFLRTAVQLVFQDPRSSLDPRMKIGDIITEPLRSPLLRGRQDVPTDHRARLVEVMESVELNPADAHRYPHEFSGGQRQRIAIARALAPKPRVLVADEPVSALDVSVRAHVLNLLNDLVAQMGLTLVFVSHDLNVVRHVCQNVVVMRSGKIVERGSVAEVYGSPQEQYTRDLLAAVPSIRTRREAP